MGSEGCLVHMQPACWGGLIVGGQHIDGIKGSQELIGSQQELKHLRTALMQVSLMHRVVLKSTMPADLIVRGQHVAGTKGSQQLTGERCGSQVTTQALVHNR